MVTSKHRKEIRVIADKFSAHKTKFDEQFLADHPKMHLYFALAHSSWLNQIELSFSKIKRGVTEFGVFPSVPDLKQTLVRYIHQYNNVPKRVRWGYFDLARSITSSSVVTVH